MAEGGSDCFQYKFQVEEATEGTDGEVIIIYNNGEEITPEILAKTLEELSTHLSLQRMATQNQNPVIPTETDSDVCLPIDDIHLNIQLDSSTLDIPVIKVELPRAPEEMVEGSLSQENANPEMLVDLTSHQNDSKSVINVDTIQIIKDNSNQEIYPKSDAPLDASAPDKTILTLPIIPTEEFPMKEEMMSDEEEEILSSYPCDKCAFISQTERDYQRHQKQEHKERNPFICRYCNKAFQLELSLSIHKLGHSQKMCSVGSNDIYKVLKYFTCPLCEFQYQRKRQLNTHMKTQHDSKTYLLCCKCYYSCLTADELAQHLSSSAHDEEGRTNCPLCGTATKDIRQHLRRTHNEDRPFLCTQCGFKAKTATHLNNHMVIHDPVKRVQCDLCSYKCRTKDQLKKHLVKHSSEKEFKCNLCPFACKTGMSLKRHMHIHETPNKYVCNICEYTTHDKLILRKHKAQEHILKASYKCRQCDCQFDRVVELKKHALAEHKSERTQFCSYCDFAGLTPAELRTHMQTHFGKFSYTCNVCGYMCRLKTSYQRHIERHSKVKKFMCTICSYASVEKYDLQKHYVHRHSEDKPLSCPYCPYRCKFKPRLNNHISYVHTDIKPFFCKLCPYTGKSAENLKKHMANHGVVLKTLRCVLCDYATAEKAKLKRHMKVHVKKAVFQCRKVAF
ncbi:gastrula zinc finger protein XlCGF58.1 [Biomphalaria glabrata]|nr:gastrula zinc finger protein XlCGF58.1 [Biomphalaria glabrata]